MTQHQAPKGIILEILRMSTEDGPGIRTTVFFKGCSLACRWCHNPESIRSKPQIQWIKTGCIGCGICVETCPERALTKTPKGVTINRLLCTGCGLCIDACPNGVLIMPEDYTVPIKCSNCGDCVLVCPRGAIYDAEVLSAEGAL